MKSYLQSAKQVAAFGVAQGRGDALAIYDKAVIKRPDAPDPETPVIPLDQVSKLLGVCDRSTLHGARDRAIMRLLLDIGPRVGAVAAMKLEDVDLDNQLVWIELKRAKGKHKALPFGDEEAVDLERYLRRRRLSPFEHLPWLWLGLRGRFTASGIAQMLTSRAEQAGLGPPHPSPHVSSHVRPLLEAERGEG